MPYQRALTIVAPVRAGARGELESLLATMGNGVANGSVVDFGKLSGLHFARLAVIEEDQGLPAHLILMTDVDVSAAKHLGELAEQEGLDRLFAYCEGYSGDRLGYLRRHAVKEQAVYVNTRGRTASQIKQEAKLREAIQDFLDSGDWNGRRPAEIRQAVREHVQSNPELAWALEPAERPSRLARLREKLHLVGMPLLLLPFLPLLLLSLPVFAVILRLHERRDGTPPHVKQREERILELAALEDHLVHNPFMAVGHVKPGAFRILTLRAILLGLNYTTRHIFNRGVLSGVKTIHFARWVFIDGRRRMFFASNYDGSMESLHGRLHRQGRLGSQPRLLERHRLPEDELAGLRRRQARARVQGLPAGAPGADARLVLRLRRPDGAEHRAERADPRGLARRRRAEVGAGAVTLELADVQGLFARGYGDLKSAAFLLLKVEDRRRRAALAR